MKQPGTVKRDGPLDVKHLPPALLGVPTGIVLSEGSCDPSAALKIRVSCCESQEGQLDISASWLEMDAAVGAEGSRV